MNKKADFNYQGMPLLFLVKAKNRFGFSFVIYKNQRKKKAIFVQK